jgi:acyl-coenzyme A synthetase/AMP-(fatty) acid ligase
MELKLRGEAVFDGYLNEPDISDWLKTGDLVRYHGRNLHFVCRKAELLHVEAGPQSPLELEEQIVSRFPAIRECMITNSPRSGSGLQILLGAGSSTKRLEFHSIRDFIARSCRMPGTSVQVAAMARLPRTSSGKLMRGRSNV